MPETPTREAILLVGVFLGGLIGWATTVIYFRLAGWGPRPPAPDLEPDAPDEGW